MMCGRAAIATLMISFYAITSVAQEAQRPNVDIPSGTLGLDDSGVAVLPFEVLSTDPKASDLAVMFYGALLRGLEGIEGVHVVASDRVLPFADSSLSPAETARALGVGGIITGDVRVRNGSWTVQVARVDARSGQPVWVTLSNVGSVAGDSLSSERVLREASRAASLANPLRTGGPTREQAVEAMQSTVLDSSRPDAERVAALHTVPGIRDVIKAGELSDYVVEALAAIAVESDDASVRLEVWQILADLDESALVRPLLYSLTNDVDEDVRREVADRLVETFLQEPDVELALQFAMLNDPSERVRNHIHLSLLSDDERVVELRGIALDSTRTEWDRLSAVTNLRHRDGESMTLDHEVVLSTVQIGLNSRRPRARYWALSLVSGIQDPYLLEPYLALLANDGDEQVREEAARGLAQFVDLPKARMALEEAAEDASLVVRRAAEQSLRTQ